MTWPRGRGDRGVRAYPGAQSDDNQGVRFCVFEARSRTSREKMRERDECGEARRRKAAQQARARRPRAMIHT